MTSRRRHRTKDPSPTATEAGPDASTASGPEQSILNFKVAPTADIDSTLKRLQGVEGFRTVEQLFPGENEPDLSTIYVAHVDTDRLATVMPEIEADDDIEYVEEPPSRKLIR